MDYLDLEKGRLDSGYWMDVTQDAEELPIGLFISEGGSPHSLTGLQPTALTFDPILKDTTFVSLLRARLGSLEKSFGRPVEIEFSADFTFDREPIITLTACRTLPDLSDVKIDPNHRFLEARGAVIGSSRLLSLDSIVYVTPEAYGVLSLSDRYEVARVMGTLTRALNGCILLLGPGRWGTTSPELGIPTSFSEIRRASSVAEIVAMRKNFAPEVSMGAHMLNELVATDMLYFAVFPEGKGQFVNADVLAEFPNRLSKLTPEAKRWERVIHVIEPETGLLRADVLKKEVVGWLPYSTPTR